MSYIKNIAFTSLIKVNGRLREFNFRKRSASLYDGDTNDDRGDRYFFKVEKLEGRWTLKGFNMPSWLTQNELDINNVIVKQEEETINQAGLVK